MTSGSNTNESSFWTCCPISLSFDVSKFGTALLRLCAGKGLLDNALVPLEGFAQLFNPLLVLAWLLPLHEWHTESRLFDSEHLSLFHLEAHLAIKGDPSSCTGFLWELDANLAALWKYKRSESKWMWTDWSETYDFSCRMSNRTTTREIVGSASRRSRDQDSVALHYGEQCIINIDIKSTHEFSVPTCDWDLIKCVTNGWLDLFSTLTVDKCSFPNHGRFAFEVLYEARKPWSVIDFCFFRLWILCIW